MSDDYDIMKVVSVEDVDIDTLSSAELLDRYCYFQTMAAITKKVDVQHKAKELREIILKLISS